MDRLTYFEHGKNRVMFEGTEYSNKIIDRLAAYEDTGLTPERCAELAQADREGRVAIIPILDKRFDFASGIAHRKCSDCTIRDYCKNEHNNNPSCFDTALDWYDKNVSTAEAEAAPKKEEQSCEL